MRLQLWSPHQSCPTLQIITPMPTAQHTTPIHHMRIRSTLTLGISHTQRTITQHTRILDTRRTLIPDIQTTMIPNTTLTHDISRIHDSQHPQIPGFQVTQTV